MKTLLTLVLLSLICFLHHTSAGAIGPSAILEAGCCRGYDDKTIPEGKVVKVERTPENCASKALLVTSKANVTFCIDPDCKWAKNKLLKLLKPANSPLGSKV